MSPLLLLMILISIGLVIISVLYLITNLNRENPCECNDSKTNHWEKPVCEYGPPFIAFTAILLLLLLLYYLIVVKIWGSFKEETIKAVARVNSARSAVGSAVGRKVRATGQKISNVKSATGQIISDVKSATGQKISGASSRISATGQKISGVGSRLIHR